MSFTLTVPKLGAEGVAIEVGTWLVEPGEPILEGERLVELQLPGMVFVVSADRNGTVGDVLAQTGASVAEGDPLVRINTETDEAELR